MGRFILAVAAGASSVVIGVSSVNAAGKGSANGNPSPGPQGLATGNSDLTAGAPAVSTGPSSDTSGSTMTMTPAIQPSGSDDKVNVRGTILRLPF